VTVIDCATNQILDTIYAGYPYKLAWNSQTNKLYCLADGELTVIDCATSQVDTTVSVPPSDALLWTPRQNKLYLSNSHTGPDALVAVDGATYRIIRSYSNAGYLSGMTWNAYSDRLYAANAGGEFMLEIDCQSDSVKAEKPLRGGGPVLWDSLSDKIYCACDQSSYDHDHVAVFDCALDTVTQYIPAGPYMLDLAWDPVEDRIYVANEMASSITVIRDRLGTTESKRDEPSCPVLEVSTNPVRGALSISYALPARAKAAIRVYNILGVKVFDQEDAPRSLQIRDLPAGVYVVRLETRGLTGERKVVVLK
jgi:DNA-binding beta-propeller fold protein YncE